MNFALYCLCILVIDVVADFRHVEATVLADVGN